MDMYAIVIIEVAIPDKAPELKYYSVAQRSVTREILVDLELSALEQSKLSSPINAIVNIKQSAIIDRKTYDGIFLVQMRDYLASLDE